MGKAGYEMMAKSFLIFAKYEPIEEFGIIADINCIICGYTPPEKMTKEEVKFLNDNDWEWVSTQKPPSWFRFT
jgi:hypothetical protein